MQILLPVIKQKTLEIAKEMLSVQPMASETYSLFRMKTRMYYMPEDFLEGTRRHSFGDGWQRMYGKEWIVESLWWKLKIKGF